jgi:hypothetical protein
MTLNQFLATGMVFIGLLWGLLLWGLLLIWLDRKESQEQRDANRRARLAFSPTGVLAYDSGAMAALEGKQFWDNPHYKPTGMRGMAEAWNAGWCYGMQLLLAARRATP